MKILIAHSGLETLNHWQAQLASHSCIIANNVAELVTAYVAHEPHLTFVGGELTFPTVTPDLILGEPANVLHVSTLAEIQEALAKPWQTPPPTCFDRETPRLSWWGEGWPESTEKLRVGAVKNDEASFEALLQGARLNHEKAKAWAQAFAPFYEAVVAEVTYRLPHGSWKTLSYLQNTSLRLCGAISLYLQVFETCLPTPLHPRINFISRTPPEHLQTGAKAILANSVNPAAGGMLEILLRAPTDFEISDGLDAHAQRLLGIMIYLHSTLQAHLAAFEGFLNLRAPEGDWMRTARTVFEFWDLRSFNRASESTVLSWLTQLGSRRDRNAQAGDTPPRLPRQFMQSLKQLIEYATKYSLHHLRRSDHVPPTLLATTPEGVMAYVPEKMTNDSDKDNFALIAQLITVAYEAEAVAMILESWLTLGPEASLPDTSPSQSPNRKEAIVITGETHQSSAQRFLFIQRNALGRFTSIGPNLVPHFDSMRGRFAQILSPHVPSKIDAEKARVFLRAMGIVVVHKGSDPRWN